MLHMMPRRRDRRPPRPAFVELHPLDDGSGLPPVFFERDAPRFYLIIVGPPLIQAFLRLRMQIRILTQNTHPWMVGSTSGVLRGKKSPFPHPEVRPFSLVRSR